MRLPLTGSALLQFSLWPVLHRVCILDHSPLSRGIPQEVMNLERIQSRELFRLRSASILTYIDFTTDHSPFLSNISEDKRAQIAESVLLFSRFRDKNTLRYSRSRMRRPRMVALDKQLRRLAFTDVETIVIIALCFAEYSKTELFKLSNLPNVQRTTT